MLKNNQLRSGKVDVSGHEIDLAAIRVPVLVFAGNTDGIAPIASVKAILPLLQNAREVRFEIVPGGHLGMLTGRAARRTTWVVLDEWIATYSTQDSDEPARRKPASSGNRRKTAKKTAKKPAKKTAKRPAKKTVGKAPAPSTAVAPERGAIGSNPARRFNSEASRGLARKR
jgi:polyhydroxyalkanoate synthase subunit PhaC